MTKRTLAILVLTGLIAGCSSEPTLRQMDCLERGKFRYEGECVNYYDVPTSEQERIWIEIADEIAEERGITRDEALLEILEILESNAN